MAAISPTQVPAQHHFCGQCGATVQTEQTYCQKCGLALEDPPERAPLIRRGRAVAVAWGFGGVCIVAALIAAFFIVSGGRSDDAATGTGASGEQTARLPAPAPYVVDKARPISRYGPPDAEATEAAIAAVKQGGFNTQGFSVDIVPVLNSGGQTLLVMNFETTRGSAFEILTGSEEASRRFFAAMLDDPSVKMARVTRVVINASLRSPSSPDWYLYTLTVPLDVMQKILAGQMTNEQAQPHMKYQIRQMKGS